MDLGTILFHVREFVGDAKLTKLSEPSLVFVVNQCKDRLAHLIVQARQDFFLTSSTGTIPAATPPNPSTITLPDTFSELKEIELTETAFQSTAFAYLNRHDPRFRQALRVGGVQQLPSDAYYYDIIGLRTMEFAPGFNAARAYRIYYVQTVPNLVARADIPSLIPLEFHDWIVDASIAEVLRKTGDNRIEGYLLKLAERTNEIRNQVGARQIRDVVTVSGYMDDMEGY